MKGVISLFLSLFFFLSLNFEVFAVEGVGGKAEIKAHALEEVVVTATRTEIPVELSPASTKVVTKKEIEQKPILTIDQAINDVAGVHVRRGKGLMDTLATISLRGFSGQERTLILLDGIPLNNAYSSRATFAGIPTEDLERVEVVKGPFSNLYGGYAMGGVVNFLTKMPEKREVYIKTGYGSSFKRGEAQDDLWKVYLSYGDRLLDRLSFRLSYSYKSTNGYPSDFVVERARPTQGIIGWKETTDIRGNTRYLIGDRGDNTWWDYNFNIRIGLDLTERSKVLLTYMRTAYEYDYDKPHTYLRNATTGAEVWSYGTGPNRVPEGAFLSTYGGRLIDLYSIRYDTAIKDIKIKAQFSLLNELNSWYVAPDRQTAKLSGEGKGKITDTPTRYYNTEFQLNFPLLDRHLITLGFTYAYGWADSKEHDLSKWRDKDSKERLFSRARGKIYSYSVFLQDEIPLFEKLTLFVGFRQDWWKNKDGYVYQDNNPNYPIFYPSRSSSAFSPKIGILYKPFEKTTLRANLGKAFRAPNVYELYKTWTTTGGITYASNPNLKPETTLSWDIGWEQILWNGSKIRVTYFNNDVKDLIYSRDVNATYKDKVNAGRALIRGIEIEAEQKLNSWLRLFANYTYNDAKFRKNEVKPETEGKRLSYVPQRMFNVGLGFEINRFQGLLTGRYVSKLYTTDTNEDKVNRVYGSYDPHFVVDASLSYKFNKNISLSLFVNNIFNREYFIFYKAPGRSWFGELSIKF